MRPRRPWHFRQAAQGECCTSQDRAAAVIPSIGRS